MRPRRSRSRERIRDYKESKRKDYVFIRQKLTKPILGTTRMLHQNFLNPMIFVTSVAEQTTQIKSGIEEACQKLQTGFLPVMVLDLILDFRQKSM